LESPRGSGAFDINNQSDLFRIAAFIEYLEGHVNLSASGEPQVPKVGSDLPSRESFSYMRNPDYFLPTAEDKVPSARNNYHKPDMQQTPQTPHAIAVAA